VVLLNQPASRRALLIERLSRLPSAATRNPPDDF
jgi:hypothetical protein